MLGFFSRGVEHWSDLAREVCGRLKQQRALANTGFAAEQYKRAGHNAAAKDTIELVDPSREAHALRCFNFCVQFGCRCCRELRIAAVAGRRRSRISDALFDERVPRAAFSATASPLGRLRTALLTNENSLRRLHGSGLWALGFGPSRIVFQCACRGDRRSPRESCR